MVDLRYRYFISKLDLAQQTPRQALPGDTAALQVRERFKLRVAQRYMRSAVPEQLVETVVRPLNKIVANDPRITEIFSEWMIYQSDRDGSLPGLRGMFETPDYGQFDAQTRDDMEASARQEAEDKFEQVMEALPDTARAALDVDDEVLTQAIDARDLTVAAWRRSWKIELDGESFNGREGAALPAR